MWNFTSCKKCVKVHSSDKHKPYWVIIFNIGFKFSIFLLHSTVPLLLFYHSLFDLALKDMMALDVILIEHHIVFLNVPFCAE